MPKRIGITGGIGAGKSTVSKIIETMGFPVFNSDIEAKSILDNHPEVKNELIALFGISQYCEIANDRKKMAALIFKDPSLRQKVNQIIHPRVRFAFDEFLQNSTSELVFNEAAILFETGAYTQFDATILITTPKEIRMQRLLKRDNATVEEIEARINAQWSDDKKRELADYEIKNDEKQPLIIQIEKVISEIRG